MSTYLVDFFHGAPVCPLGRSRCVKKELHKELIFYGAPKQPGLELLYIVMDEQCVIEKVAESVRVIYDNRSACHQEVIY